MHTKLTSFEQRCVPVEDRTRNKCLRTPCAGTMPNACRVLQPPHVWLAKIRSLWNTLFDPCRHACLPCGCSSHFPGQIKSEAHAGPGADSPGLRTRGRLRDHHILTILAYICRRWLTWSSPLHFSTATLHSLLCVALL